MNRSWWQKIFMKPMVPDFISGRSKRWRHYESHGSPRSKIVPAVQNRWKLTYREFETSVKTYQKSPFSGNYGTSNLTGHRVFEILFYCQRFTWIDFMCIHNLVGSSNRHKPCRPWIDENDHFVSRQVSDSQLFLQEDQRKYLSPSFALKYFDFADLTGLNEQSTDLSWALFSAGRETYRFWAEWIMLPAVTIMQKFRSFIFILFIKTIRNPFL